MYILLEGLPEVVAIQEAAEVPSAAEEPVKFLAQNVAWISVRPPFWLFDVCVYGQSGFFVVVVLL